MPPATDAAAPTATRSSTTTHTNGRSDLPVASEPDNPAVGLAWRRVDLHIHTPGSVDYQQPAATYLDILRRAEERGLDVIAFTDHNSVRGYAELWREIEDLELLEDLKRIEPAEAERLREYRRLLGAVLLLPGFEFTAQFGFHVLAIFPAGTSVRKMEHLLLALGVPEERFGSGEVGATSDVLRAYELLADHGAIVIGAHVNSTHGVAMQGLRFGGQTKIAYTQDPRLAALEVTDLALGPHRRSTARFFNGTKPEYPRRMHAIQGSDAHRLERDPDRESNLGVGDRPTEMLLPEVSFAAIRDLFRGDDFDRTRPFTPVPDDPVKAARLDGPGDDLAFHESIASRRAGTGLALALRDIAAMANTAGGTVFVGANASEKRAIAGVPDAAAAEQDIRQGLAEGLSPALPVEVTPLASGGKTVLRVDVPRGDERPYALAGSIFVRRGADSEPASRDEIVAMVRGDLAVPKPAPVEVRVSAPADVTTPPVPAAPAGESAPARASGNKHRSQPDAKAGPSPESSTPAPATVPAGLDVTEEPVEPDPIAPTTGIEVINSFEQDGTTYYTIRDLRYHKLISNVTRETDRRLLRSAISQYEEGEIDPASVKWRGDYGLARGYRLRGGDRRFNLVYRGDGVRTFYGVSDAGMTGGWAVLRDKTATHAPSPESAK